MFFFFHLPILTRTLLISLLAILTLVGIMVRPFKLDEPSLGPKSVGHVARFVLDHAPCPVLLIRGYQLPG